jgi:hypothetical protein
MSAPALTSKARRSLRLFGFAALPVLSLAGVVQITGVGIDILVVATAALLLFGVERSIGDLLGEWVGPLASAMIVVFVVIALSWYFLDESLGRSRTDHFFTQAERRGYRTVYYETAESAADQSAAASSSTGGASTSAGGAEGVGEATSTSGTHGGSASRAASAEPAEDRRNDETAPSAPSNAGKPVKERSATRAIRSFFRRNVVPTDPIATEVALTVTPSRVMAAHRAVITAAVRSGGEPVTWGAVEFTANGLGAGRVNVNAEGIATTTFQTYLAGTYEIRARFAGSPEYSSSRSKPVILSVVGGK